MPDQRRKKLLMYAGIAGALIAVVVLIKRRQAPAGEAAGGEAGGPVYASAPSSIPAAGESGEGTALRQELAAFEGSLAQQLPQAIREGVASGMTNNTPAAPPSNLTDLIGALGGFIGAVNSSRTGEQTGANQQSPSQNTPPTQLAPHPSEVSPPPAPAPPPPAPPPPAPAPKPGCPPGYPNSGPHGCYRDATCPNGCAGHFYANGAKECQQGEARKHTCHW